MVHTNKKTNKKTFPFTTTDFTTVFYDDVLILLRDLNKPPVSLPLLLHRPIFLFDPSSHHTYQVSFFFFISFHIFPHSTPFPPQQSPPHIYRC